MIKVTVLDIGCGTLKRGDVGIDQQRTSNVDIVADAHHLPIRDCAFDGCFAYAVLEHVKKPVLVMREINRVLKKNAWLKIRVPRDSRLRFDTFMFAFTFNKGQLKQQYEFLKAGIHKWQFSTKKLKKVLSQVGFLSNIVTFSELCRETGKGLPINVFEHLRNIYIIAHKK